MDTRFLSSWIRSWKRTGPYHPLGSQGDPARGESSRMSHVSQIRRVREQVERCIDADLLLPDDGQRLLTALDDALAALTESAAVVDQERALLAAGVLNAGEGQPPNEAAPARVAGLARAGDTDG